MVLVQVFVLDSTVITAIGIAVVVMVMIASFTFIVYVA